MKLAGKAVLVTGGGTGIGRALVLALAERGAKVAIGYASSRDGAFAARDEARGHGVRAEAFAADLLQPGAPERLVAQATEALGGLDALVNNAATTVWIPLADLEAVDEDTWDTLQSLNVKAPFLAARAAARHMPEGGSIVNVASMAGLLPRGSSLPYSVSKAGLIHLTRLLAVALAPRIRVNAVAPGDVATDWARRHGGGSYAHPGALPPERVATAVLDLLEDDTLTGQVVTFGEPDLPGVRPVPIT